MADYSANPHTTDLRLSDELDLPISAVTDTFVVVGKRGSGKTNTVTVMVEEMDAAGASFVVIDPVGVWWGLRHGPNGGPDGGLAVIVLGGEHGDLPLDGTAAAGEAVAELVVAERVNVVLDLSLLRKNEQREFLIGFLETLYHRNREALHLAFDEADIGAPQRPVKGTERLLGAMDDIVRRGRVRGIGVSLITQRPAVLHKDVMSQASVLVAMRLPGPHDRDAVDAWVKAQADSEQRRKVLDSLPGLDLGQAWVWDPGREVLKLVGVRERRTFDSSRTPEVGEAAVLPTGAPAVDLTTFADRLAEHVERATENDPGKLKARIKRLEGELATARRNGDGTPGVEHVEVPVFSDKLADALRTAVADLRASADGLARDAAHVDRTAEVAREAADSVGGALDRWPERPSHRPADAIPNRSIRPAPSPGHAPAEIDVGGKLRAGPHRMLAALARPPGIRVTRAQIGTLAGLTPSGETFASYWSTLIDQGLIIEDGDACTITESGLAALGERAPDPFPMTPDEIRNLWARHLKPGARRILDILTDAHPDQLTHDELADRADSTSNAVTFSAHLSTLRRNGLANVQGDTIRAGDALFVGITTYQ